MRGLRRSLALLLSLLAVLGVFTTAAFAAGETTPATGAEQTAGGVDTADIAAPEDEAPLYILREETVITEDDTPLAAVPSPMDTFVQHDCCILHFVLMLAALGVTVCYTHDRKKRQQRQFEVRSEL